MMKKFIAFVFAAVFAAGAWAHQYEATVNGVTWYYNRISDGKGGYDAEITYRGDYYYSYDNEYSGSLTIPSTLGGYTVTTIGSYAFYDCSSLTSITIPDSVTTIGDCAFYNCSSLTSITIPESVTSIGSSAFYGTPFYNNQPDGLVILGKGCLYSYKGTCPSSITIPDSVTTIGSCAFFGCSSLTSVTIPDSVTTIGYYAFRDCRSLTSITIPDSVTSIGDDSFRYCSSLTSITIPDSVTTIGNRAFCDCSSLTSVTIPDSVTTIGSGTFYGCSSLSSVTIPDSVTEIGSGAFSDCSSLTSITIPDSVTEIGSGTFYGCSSLKEFVVGENNSNYRSINGLLCTKDGKRVVFGVNGDVMIPDSVTSIGSDAFYGCSSLTSVTIPEGVTTIGNRAFYGCSSLKAVTIPDSVTTIGSLAFDGCSLLTSITIPDSVTTIGSLAFYNCSSLNEIIGWRPGCPTNVKRIVISDSVTSIGNRAFYNCSSLASVTIPNSVTTIGSEAFDGCSSLTSVTIPGRFTLSNVFPNAYKKISSIEIASGETSIAQYAFYDCSSLTSVTIPDSVTEIGDYAFQYCSSLTSITIPDSVKTIGSYAFSYCSSLEFIDIPIGVDSVEQGSFCGCSSIKEVVIPEGVRLIDASAFAGCSSLESVSIPASLKLIERWAFEACDALKRVNIEDLAKWLEVDYDDTDSSPCAYAKHIYLHGEEIVNLVIPDGVTKISWQAFRNCEGIKSIVIPPSVTIIEDMAFYQCTGVERITYSDCIQRIGWLAFEGCNPREEVIISHSGERPILLPVYGAKLELVIEEGVTVIKESAFSNLPITSVSIPDSVQTIGRAAFRGCNSLTSLTIPNGVTEIGAAAFYDCSSLTSVTIPDSVTSIASCAFYGCSSLTSVTIPNSVTMIGERAFIYCRSLTSITIPDSVTEIGSCTFYGCSSLKEFVVGENNSNYRSINRLLCTKDGKRVVFGVNGDVMIPDGVTTIGDDAFAYYSSLSSITIPGSVTEIGSWAFSDCSSLTSITIPGSVTEIGSGAFSGCSSLTSVTIPDSVTMIGNYVFSYCDKLESVVVEPNSALTPDSSWGVASSKIVMQQDVKVVVHNQDISQTYDGCVHQARYNLECDCIDFDLNNIKYIGTSIAEIQKVGAVKSPIANSDFEYTGDDIRFRNVVIECVDEEVSIKIVPRNVSVRSRGASKCYDGQPLVSVQVIIEGDGFVTGECSVVALGSQTNVGMSKNAVAINWAEGASADNYDISIQEGELIVLPRSVSITSGSASKVYDGTPLTASYSIGGDGFVDGECALAATSSRTTVGLCKNEVTINWAEGASADNYDISIQEGELTVLPRGVSITSGSASKVYDGTPLTASYSIGGGGFVDGECDVSVSSRTAAGSRKTEVTLSWAEGASADNYDISIQEGELTVLPRSVSITSDSASKVYDGTPLTASYSVGGDGFVTGECDVSTSSRTIVGSSKNEVALKWSEGASADNYAITIKEGTLTITPAQVPRIATTAFSTTYSYDGEEHTINVAGVESTTLIDPPRFSYALSAEGPWQDEAPTFKDAGRYSVWYKISADNYEDYIQEACVTILPRKLVIASVDVEKFYDGVPLKGNAVEFTTGKLVEGESFSVDWIGYQLDEGESQNTFDIVWNGSAKESNYEVLKDYGTLKVTRLFGDVGDDTISSTYPYSYKSLTEVSFTEGVEEVLASQFYGCVSLQSVKFPDSLRVIDCHALDGLPNVEWQIIDGYKMMDGWIFGYTEDAADEISNVDDIRGIAAGALDGCQAIRRFVCSESSKLKAINSQAFRYCTKLETVVLPEGLERIDDEAFIGCTKMTNVIVPGSVESIGDRAFKQCTMLTNAQIAHGVKSIGEEAFHSDWRIAEVDIPSTVTNVGSFAFGGDSSIVRASMRGDIRKISEVFSNYDHIREFTVKEGDGKLVDALFENCRELVAVRIMGDCPKMVNDGSNLYRGAGIVEMGPDDDHSEKWTNEKATITYVTEESTGWDGIPGSEALPQAWPLIGLYRRSIALWDVPTYLCQFDANGGTLGVQDTYQYSEKKIVLPPEPVQSGYTFDGWWTQPIGGLRVTENTTFIEGVYTYLWAHWVKGHWVFLDPNGGECVNEFVTYVDQSVYGVLPTPVKSGYSFGGWLYNGCIIEPETEINEKADHTITAQWTANKYKVQYNSNGGVGDLINEDWVYGETKTLRRNAFTRAGFDFVGWSTNPNATTAQYQDEEPLSSLTAKAGEVVVLYAVWEKSAAVDPTNVAFTNGGDADWQCLTQLVTKTDGIHSIATPVVWQSGKIADNQASILKTKVSGKGKLEFWWRVSCESFRTQKLDHLSFMVDGDEVKWINGEKDWAYFEHEILTSGEHEIAWAYNKDDMESDGEDCGAVCAVVWTPQLSNLSDYLNADDLTITTTGSADWFGTTEVSHDGAGAAQSGKIGDNQESRLETTVDGSGTIAFWWKVDCESYRTYKLDHVAFFIDSVEQKWINGNKDWMRESFEVSGAGAHTLAWVYAKDEEGSDGVDCAWVDEIVWTPALAPMRPEAIESASDDVKDSFDKWIAENAVSDPSAANVNAFILGLAPTATDDEIQQVVEDELENLNLSKLAEGDLSAAVEAIQAKYPNAKVELAPVEGLKTSARLYKLVIELK